jgi:hypothetical protein
MSAWLVGYDVPGIQRYVFAPARPMDIGGGSALLERFAHEAKATASDRSAGTVYSGGGAGMFEVATEADARGLMDALRAKLAEITAGGAELTAACVPLEETFVAAWARLRRALAAERLRRIADRPTDILLPPGTRPSDVCVACGLEEADRDSPVGAGEDREIDRIGARCAARREEGRKTRTVETIRDLFPRTADVAPGGRERLPRDAVLAVLYLDGDRLGRRLGAIADLESLRAASGSIAQGIAEAIAAARSAVGEPPTLAPVVGGDDIVLFSDARHAAELLHHLWEELDRRVVLDGQPVRFSAAIVLGDPYLPLRLFFDEATAALDDAKASARRAGTAHVELRSLLTGRLHPGRGASLTGRPLPRSAFWDDRGSLRALLQAIGEVAPAQRSAIASDLEEPSPELRALLLEDRATRHDEVARFTALVDQVSAGADLPPDALCVAALALAEVWSEAAP